MDDRRQLLKKRIVTLLNKIRSARALERIYRFVKYIFIYGDDDD